jgi:hypothetical protein
LWRPTGLCLRLGFSLVTGSSSMKFTSRGEGMAIKLRRETKRHLVFCLRYRRIAWLLRGAISLEGVIFRCRKFVASLSRPHQMFTIIRSCSRLPLTLESSSASLNSLLLCDRYDCNVHLVEAHTLQQILRVRVHVQRAIVGVLGEVERRNFRDVLIFSFSLFFLQFEGDASDGSTLNSLH